MPRTFTVPPLAMVSDPRQEHLERAEDLAGATW